MRLIDAERVTEGKFHSMPMLQKYSDRNLAYMYGWNDALDAVAKNAPTVEKRLQGKWKSAQKRDGYLRHITEYVCTNCEMYSEFPYRYCPECGADMRGGENA